MGSPVQPIDVIGVIGKVRLTVAIPHGKRTRNVEVDVPAAVILRLADCIRGCPQHVYEDPATGRKPRSVEEAHDPRFVPIWIGHAIWHLNNPERLMPCLDDNARVFDAPTTEPVLLRGRRG